MSTDRNELVTIKVKLHQETADAILVGPSKQFTPDRLVRKEWLPSSFISHKSGYEIGSIIEVEIPRWLAEKKDLESHIV